MIGSGIFYSHTVLNRSYYTAAPRALYVSRGNLAGSRRERISAACNGRTSCPTPSPPSVSQNSSNHLANHALTTASKARSRGQSSSHHRSVTRHRPSHRPEPSSNLASRGCSILGTCSSSDNVHIIESINHEIELLYTDAAPSRKPDITGISANILSPNCAETIANVLQGRFAGRVDIFVNNAADSGIGQIGEMTVEEIQNSLISNIQTPVLIVDELVKRKMFQLESRIIYISSVRSRQPWSMQLMYAAGKSAGESLCRTWSQAFGGREEKVSWYLP